MRDAFKKQEYPVVLKTVSIEQPDVATAVRQLRLSDQMRRVAAEVMAEMMGEMVERSNDGWDRLAQVFGYDSSDAVQYADCCIIFDMLNKEVTLRGKRPKEEPQP